MIYELKGIFTRIANGHFSYEVFALNAGAIPIVENWIRQEFGLEARTPPVFGLDSDFHDLWQGNIMMTLSWDNWSGLFIHAYGDEGDSLIQEIGAYLEPRLSELEEFRYIPPSSINF